LVLATQEARNVTGRITSFFGVSPHSFRAGRNALHKRKPMREDPHNAIVRKGRPWNS
jgi:hypothetical protein